VKTNVPIILASSSPRRRELLKGLGLQFEVIPSDVDETRLAGELPEALVKRLSVMKAKAIAATYPEALIIAADTTVALGQEILEKPRDLIENKQFVRRLAGKTHEVYTGHALIYGGKLESLVKRSEVTFRQLSEEEIERYVATGEGLDKAGGYAIQGHGAALIPHIKGCYFNVVGLSVATVVEMASGLGVQLL
jgi:septum formation protein